MLGVSGCQLDFVLLIATLWDWSLASFPCRYLIHGKMIWLYVFFRQLCPMPPKNQAKLYCSPLVHQASLLRKLSELSGTINPWNFPPTLVVLSLSCPFISPALILFLGLEHSWCQAVFMRLLLFLKLYKKNHQKQDVVEQRWKSLPEAADSLFVLFSSFWDLKCCMRKASTLHHLSALFAICAGACLCLLGNGEGKDRFVSEEGVLPSHPCCLCTPCVLGSALPLAEPGQFLLADSWCWTCWKQELLVTICLFLQSLVFKPFKLTCKLHRPTSHTARKPFTINPLQPVFCSALGYTGLCMGSLCHWRLPIFHSLICPSLAAWTYFNSGWLSNLQFSRKTSCVLACVNSAGDFLFPAFKIYKDGRKKLSRGARTDDYLCWLLLQLRGDMWAGENGNSCHSALSWLVFLWEDVIN